MDDPWQTQIEVWEKAMRRARLGPRAAANAMAAYLKWRAAEVTLRRTSHAPGAYHRARPGEPPAYASGRLARSIYVAKAYSGIRASAIIGSKAPYASIAEKGCVVSAASKEKTHWTDSAGRWYHWQTEHPPHPWMEPTVQEAIDDGSLQEVAIDAFRKYDP